MLCCAAAHERIHVHVHMCTQAAAPDSDDDDEGLLKRVEGADESDEGGPGPTKELLEEVFDPSDEKDRFLKDYIASKAR